MSDRPTSLADAQIVANAAESIDPNVEIARAVVAEAILPTRIIEGTVDAVNLGTVVGWAQDTADSQARVEVEIVVDGTLVGRTIANTYRGDLFAAKIGDGQYGFQFELPRHLFDGHEHEIDVRDVLSGTSLHGTPQTFSAETVQSFDVVLEGTALVGWADFPGRDVGTLLLHVTEAGKSVAEGVAQPVAESNSRVQFRVPLPVELFDGAPHAFSVIAEDPSWILAQMALVMPAILTPTDALQRYAPEGVTPSLANVPALRYEALSAALASLRADTRPETLPQRLDQIAHCHGMLVRGAQDTDREFVPLYFDYVAAPEVSIVIPIHNKFAVTYHCLASILLAPSKATFEIILVDDGSSDISKKIPELIKGVTYLRNEEAQGFVLSSNRGAAAARGDYVVMLNNDTEVTVGWLDELVWPFEHFSDVGMTGGKLIYPNGRLQEAGGIVWNTGDPWNYGRYANAADPRYNYTRQVDYLSGACVMLPTKLWKEIGGFDEAFVPAYFEDTDLAFRVREKGLKTVYAPKALVIHYEGVSSGTSTSSGMKRFQEVNRPKFKSRWVRATRSNGKVGSDVDLNKDRNVVMRALVLDIETPQPDKNAGGYAALQEIRLLQALGFKCTFAPVNMAWLAHYTEQLQRMGVECLYSPFATSVQAVIEQRGSEFDLVYITRYNVAEQCVDALRKFAPQAKVVLNNADLHFLRELRAGLAAANQEGIARSVQTRDRELAVMRRADLVLSYTDVEKAVIQSHNLDSTRVARCPWVVDVAPRVPGFEARRDIAFLGGFNHHPNAEAVEWFVAKVMPLLSEAIPDVRFRVYGSFVPKSLLELAEKEENVVIEGWVPSVRQVYDNCKVFVAPLRSGAGIKGKVVDALAHGVPCVLSPVAAEGIAARDGVDVFIADSPDSWVKAIATLYSDTGVWSEMSRQALSLATARYGFARGVREMQEALTEVEIFTNLDNPTLVAS